MLSAENNNPRVGYKLRGSIFKSEEKTTLAVLLGKKGLKTLKQPYGISKKNPWPLAELDLKIQWEPIFLTFLNTDQNALFF